MNRSNLFKHFFLLDIEKHICFLSTLFKYAGPNLHVIVKRTLRFNLSSENVFMFFSYLEEVVLCHKLVHNCVSCQAFVSVAIRTKSDNSALASITSRAVPIGIYVIGGRNGIDSQLSSVERYDVMKEQWIPMVRHQ